MIPCHHEVCFTDSTVQGAHQIHLSGSSQAAVWPVLQHFQPCHWSAIVWAAGNMDNVPFFGELFKLSTHELASIVCCELFGDAVSGKQAFQSRDDCS